MAAARYKFIRGAGDDAQAAQLSQASQEGYKATLLAIDESKRGSNQQVLVLLEKES